MAKFMAFVDGVDEYPEDQVYTEAQLLALRPENIVSYFNLLAYGTQEPGPQDRPTHCRSSSLEQQKKALSYFHPHKLVAWNVQSEFGNPTRSVAVNNCIKSVKLHEVRKEGRPSSAKRDLKRGEFKRMIEILSESVDHYRRRTCPTMMCTHVHIIARSDDLSHVESKDLRSHPIFSQIALEMAVSWSKNVLEERQCPPQILLGSWDAIFCVLLHLAGYLESSIEHNALSKYLFGSPNRDDYLEPGRINERYSRTLRQLWTSNVELRELIRETRGALGSHR